jgi:hypothetical protein
MDVQITIQKGISMHPSTASELASTFTKVILENQATVLGSHMLTDEENAKTLARSIAAFRLELVGKLSEQP